VKKKAACVICRYEYVPPLHLGLLSRAVTRGKQAWQLPKAQRLIIFLISVNSSLCVIYFCDTSSHRL
jgi:hypothetical protein